MRHHESHSYNLATKLKTRAAKVKSALNWSGKTTKYTTTAIGPDTYSHSRMDGLSCAAAPLSAVLCQSCFDPQAGHSYRIENKNKNPANQMHNLFDKLQ